MHEKRHLVHFIRIYSAEIEHVGMAHVTAQRATCQHMRLIWVEYPLESLVLLLVDPCKPNPLQENTTLKFVTYKYPWICNA